MKKRSDDPVDIISNTTIGRKMNADAKKIAANVGEAFKIHESRLKNLQNKKADQFALFRKTEQQENELLNADNEITNRACVGKYYKVFYDDGDHWYQYIKIIAYKDSCVKYVYINNNDRENIMGIKSENISNYGRVPTIESFLWRSAKNEGVLDVSECIYDDFTQAKDIFMQLVENIIKIDKIVQK